MAKLLSNSFNIITLVINNEKHVTLALVALSNTRKEIVVSFRGAINIWNFVLDGIFNNGNVPGRSHNDNIKMHTGFYIATISLYDEVSYLTYTCLYRLLHSTNVYIGRSEGIFLSR